MDIDPLENPPQEEEPSFELTPEQATALGPGAEKPSTFNRKRTLIIISAAFAAVVLIGLLINTAQSSKKTSKANPEISASNPPDDVLRSLRDRALSRREPAPQAVTAPEQQEPETATEPPFPTVSFQRAPAANAQQQQQPQTPAQQQQTQEQPPQDMTQVYRSALVPPVEGSLFRQQPQAAPPNRTPPDDNYRNPATAAQNPAGPASDYAAQNDQAGKQAFFDSSQSGGEASNAAYLGENSVWIGTIIPGILETAVNTDLPGNILARVTRNIYDSLTGRKLLIPQGSVLIAQYNSSVSFAQRRVQIVWDTLVRPDGLQLDLGGMNAVDAAGMSGQKALYHENWFEYLKAAGVVTMFSLANASMTETTAKYSSDAQAAAIASSNSQLVNQLGGGMTARAMNIQPTLTVDNGSLINIMLNKTVYLPTAGAPPAARR
jgi:type IV secretion system protein VirB10